MLTIARSRYGRLAASALVLMLVFGATLAVPRPAEARFAVVVGVPLGPPIYYYPPPPVYYYPPAYYYPPPPVVYAPAPAVAAPPVAANPASDTYTAPNGQTCRQYQTTVTVNGAPQQQTGTACLEPDGTWRIVN